MNVKCLMSIKYIERIRPALRVNAISTIFLGLPERFSNVGIKRPAPKNRQEIKKKTLCKLYDSALRGQILKCNTVIPFTTTINDSNLEFNEDVVSTNRSHDIGTQVAFDVSDIQCFSFECTFERGNNSLDNQLYQLPFCYYLVVWNECPIHCVLSIILSWSVVISNS
ncbi:hypothetical protein QTP88_015120 [Uroleucon formosanum]